jgi:hypothetical protein
MGNAPAAPAGIKRFGRLWTGENKHRNIGLVLTGAYVAGALVLCAIRWAEFGWLGINEIGDFLAGVFGPLALLWVILGYLQQGEELRLTRNELRDSVEHQGEMARVAREQFDEEKRQRTADAESARRIWSKPFAHKVGVLVAGLMEVNWEAGKLGRTAASVDDISALADRARELLQWPTAADIALLEKMMPDSVHIIVGGVERARLYASALQNLVYNFPEREAEGELPRVLTNFSKHFADVSHELEPAELAILELVSAIEKQKAPYPVPE